jgi:hypothetical protein
MKDVNLLNFLKEEVVMKLERDVVRSVSDTLMKDSVLLSNFGLMDYSLLFVISFNPLFVQNNLDMFEDIVTEDGMTLEEKVKPYKLKDYYITKVSDLEAKKKFIDDDGNYMTPRDTSLGVTVFSTCREMERKFLIEMSGFDEHQLEDDMRKKIKLSKEAGIKTGIKINYHFDLMFEETTEQYEKSMYYDSSKPSIYMKKDFEDSQEQEDVEQYRPTEFNRHTFMSEDGMYLYHMGIIDYLQDFNLQKYGENKLKSIYSDGEMISAVPPDRYSMRFINFMQKTVLTNQKNPMPLKSKDVSDFKRVLREMQRTKIINYKPEETN